MAQKTPSYTVVRDTREQKNNGWTFPAHFPCDGTVTAKLKTGDYTLAGLDPTYFVIERKGSVAEFAGNLFEKRFERELERLETFDHPFIVLEFEIEDVVLFPVTSGIPKDKWPDLKVTPQLMMKRLHEFQVNYKTKFVPVGVRGREFASSLFKRINEKWHA